MTLLRLTRSDLKTSDAVSLVLIVKLATIQPGDEQSAFGPFIWLTGGLFPALFSVVMGTYVGRALHKRSTRT